jgi:lipoate-protein ligase A
MDGARNMARDHALAARLGGGEAALRVYRWDPPTVSFGRNEPARGLYDSGRATDRGLAFVRRPTGGRAVFHDRELTYAVVLPLRALGGARRTYGAVNAGLVRGLRRLGVPAELSAGGGRPTRPDCGPCFRRAAPGEVTVGGRKLVGSAQVRLGGTLLQHGSLLLEPGQGVLDELGAVAGSSGDAPTSLLEAVGRIPPFEDLVEEVVTGLRVELGGEWAPGRTLAVDPSLERRFLERYASDAWTWRR